VNTWCRSICSSISLITTENSVMVQLSVFKNEADSFSSTVHFFFNNRCRSRSQLLSVRQKLQTIVYHVTYTLQVQSPLHLQKNFLEFHPPENEGKRTLHGMSIWMLQSLSPYKDIIECWRWVSKTNRQMKLKESPPYPHRQLGCAQKQQHAPSTAPT
jgi:hypothetical protein